MRRRVLREELACRACGSYRTPTVDHILPKAEGGGDERENLQRLCRRCQQTKAAVEGNRGREMTR